MIKRILVAATIALFVSLPVSAVGADCGFPPTYAPNAPDGTKANREEITAAVEAVKVYSAAVNAFLDCQEAGKRELFLVLTREQQKRWAEDFNELVERLTSVEMSLNKQIRIFNDRD